MIIRRTLVVIGIFFSILLKRNLSFGLPSFCLGEDICLAKDFSPKIEEDLTKIALLLAETENFFA